MNDGDRIFGRATEIAGEQFQASRGLLADRIMGPLTSAALQER
jgi:peptidoglycan hydrolase-like protein with peptidoglycan-binding domain